MPEREYICIKQCYYLSRLWNPARKDIAADRLTTDIENVPEEWFAPVGGSRKPKAKSKPRATKKTPTESAAS